MSEAALLSVEDLKMTLATHRGVVPIVEGVSLEIRRGEAVALVGESGCGKSMTALSLMRLVRNPVRIGGGRLVFHGQDLSRLSSRAMRHIRGRSIAMIFQDPMTFLNPLMRVGDQIGEGLRIHQNLSGPALQAAVIRALEMVRIADPVSVAANYPHQLSGGMRQRVLIAIAIACKPSLLIADEPTTALDVTTQAQILELLAEIRRELGMAMLLITHDLGLVAGYCDRVYVMYAGQIVEHGTVERVLTEPRHPYTMGLRRASLSVLKRSDSFQTIPGQPPSVGAFPPGCRFNPRCAHAMARCRVEAPPAAALEDESLVRCWLATDRH